MSKDETTQNLVEATTQYQVKGMRSLIRHKVWATVIITGWIFTLGTFLAHSMGHLPWTVPAISISILVVLAIITEA